MNFPRKNWFEWTVFSVSFVLVVVVLSHLVYSSIMLPDTPPILVVEVGAAEQQGQGYVIPVTVRNDGDETAEDANIVVILSRGGTEVERSEFTIAYVPRHSNSNGWVTMRENPSDGQLTAYALGYEEP